MPTAGISQAALIIVMGNEYLEELSHMTERHLDPVKIEQLVNGLVHPVTKETITKYNKLIPDTLLRDDWMLAMCKELGILAQGYGKEGSDHYVQGTSQQMSPGKILKRGQYRQRSEKKTEIKDQQRIKTKLQ